MPSQLIEVDPIELIPNSFNSNVVSPEHMDKLVESLRRHGWVRPVIARRVQNGLEILGGQHRVEAAIMLGQSKVPVFDLGEVEDKRAMEIGLIDNARYGTDDHDALQAILSDLGVDSLTTFLPISEEEIAALSTEISDDEIDAALDDEPKQEEPARKSPKTHQMMRFKVNLNDAEDVEEIIASVMVEHGYMEEDDKTNAGDALIHLCQHYRRTTAAGADE